MSHFEINRTARDGAALYFQGWETELPAKAVVCLVHGLGEHSGRYAHLAEALNKAGYQVIALDLRGHGKTPGKRGALPNQEAMGKDVSLLLTEATSRYPTLPQFLYGHSMGGILVLYYTLRYKPRLVGVVSSAPGLRNALDEQKSTVMLVKILGSVLPGMTITSGLDVNAISRDPGVIERYRADPLVHDKATLGLGKFLMDAIQYVYEHANTWDLPLLLMHGTSDKIAYAEGSTHFASLVKPGCCTLHLWEGCTHELHNEPEKEEVFAFIVQYLDQRLAGVA